MKKQSIKLIAAMTLSLAMALSMSTSVFAGTSLNVPTEREAVGVVMPRLVNGIVKSFKASSSTKAYASVRASSSGITPYITCKVTLQSASLGSSSYSNVSGSAQTKTVYDAHSIMFGHTYTISSNKDYRIKIELTDETNGVTNTTTTYSTLTR